MSNYQHSDLTEKVIKAAFAVHSTLGFGFLESVYEEALCIELDKMGLEFKSQHPIKVSYRGKQIGDFKADLIVEDKVIVELKAVETVHPKHEVQLVNYLKATQVEVGLLLNFATSLEIKRKVFSNSRRK